jgi:hypothetical protein
MAGAKKLERTPFKVTLHPAARTPIGHRAWSVATNKLFCAVGAVTAAPKAHGRGVQGKDAGSKE